MPQFHLLLCPSYISSQTKRENNHKHFPTLSFHHFLSSMQPPESPSLYELLAGSGLIDYELIDPPQPHQPHPHQQQQSFCSSSYYIPMTDVSNEREGSEGISEDRTIAALRNHKEAEKRRRARINSHLDKLRSLLPCNSKTDKATLLAMVVQRVRELKQLTADMTALGTFPSESDEISVLSCDAYSEEDLLSGYGSSGSELVFKASFCCEDRSDLFPDLIEVLNSLHLKVQKAEMSTLGGRIRHVLVVAANKDQSVESIQFLQNSLKSLLERSRSAERSKRRRLLDCKIMV